MAAKNVKHQVGQRNRVCLSRMDVFVFEKRSHLAYFYYFWHSVVLQSENRLYCIPRVLELANVQTTVDGYGFFG